MLNRYGRLDQQQSSNDTIVLINPEGQHFQISHTAHMVWNMLDGETELDVIAKKIASIAEIEQPRMKTVIEEIVRGLKDVDLVG